MTRRRDDPGSEAGLERIELQDARSGMPASVWDRAIVGLFAAALVGGLAIGVGNAIGAPEGSTLPSPQATQSEGALTGWQATAEEYRGRLRELFRYTCASNGTPQAIFGTHVYTDDSSVCTAALHMGLITLQDGGTVTIQVLPPISSYQPSAQHGVISQTHSALAQGSFVFMEMPAPTWAAAPTAHRGKNRHRFTYDCARNGRPLPTWGTRVYTDDSSVCTAAVHLGLITYQGGGSVTVEMRPGRARYEGSTRNGVVSDAWDRWPGSFVIVDPR
jgi:hypothetical protein